MFYKNKSFKSFYFCCEGCYNCAAVTKFDSIVFENDPIYLVLKCCDTVAPIYQIIILHTFIPSVRVGGDVEEIF